MSYFVGVDIGGTFTDVWAINDEGVVKIAKVLSTPPHFEQGFIQGLREIARQYDVDLARLLGEVKYLGHGTTVATNVMVQRSGKRVILLVTKGHKDAFKMMRATGRTAGLTGIELADTKRTSKPDPLVLDEDFIEISERIDVDGDVIVPLRDSEIEKWVEWLREEGAEAVGISFLWSFVNPVHELRAAEIVAKALPNVFVSSGSELSPQIGEYERTAAVAINCYVGPETTSYLDGLQDHLVKEGYSKKLYLTQCAGGVLELGQAAKYPIKLFQSGPVSGINAVAGVSAFGNNVITTDMGGTSFDVGLVVDGRPIYRKTTIVDKYEYLLPTVDIQSIGSGGGSVAWYDRAQGAVKVGPRSAGALPGPACYGRGGVEVTVTDCDLVLGFLNPEYFLGGSMALDEEAAHKAVANLAGEVGLDSMNLAAGVVEIVERQMGDLVRRLTIGKGYDPREFSLLAYGGAGPVHAGGFAQDIGVAKVIVPGGMTASVWSAFGAATSQLVSVVERGCYFISPFEIFQVELLKEQLVAELDSQLGKDSYEVLWTVDMHYANQITELEVVLPDLTPDLSQGDFSEVLERRFEAQYERTYGKGAGFSGVNCEITALRGRAHKSLGQPEVVAGGKLSTIEGRERKIFWPEIGSAISTPVYRQIAERISGPVLVELPTTTVVVHKGQSIEPDDSGNLVMRVGG